LRWRNSDSTSIDYVASAEMARDIDNYGAKFERKKSLLSGNMQLMRVRATSPYVLVPGGNSGEMLSGKSLIGPD